MAKPERNVVSVFHRNAREDLEISLVEVDGCRRLVERWRLFKPLVGEPRPMENGLCFSLSVRHLPKPATALVKAKAEARARVRQAACVGLSRRSLRSSCPSSRSRPLIWRRFLTCFL